MPDDSIKKTNDDAPEPTMPTKDTIDKDGILNHDRNWNNIHNGGGGKTTSVLATNMILYDACSPNRDVVVRVLVFNSLSVESISAILYTPNTMSVGADVTSQTAPSEYVQYTTSVNNLNYMHSVFDATLPAGTTKFFVTVSDTSDMRMTSSVLVDISDPSSVCTGILFPHDLPDDTASFISKKNDGSNTLLTTWRSSIIDIYN